MHDLELARLLHADRERELARDLRVRAFKEAQLPCADEAFVPPPADRPGRISHAVRILPTLPGVRRQA